LQYRGNLLNAKNRNCCAWTKEKSLINALKYGDLKKNNYGIDYCGLEITPELIKKGKFSTNMIRKQCCGGLEGWEPENTWNGT